MRYPSTFRRLGGSAAIALAALLVTVDGAAQPADEPPAGDEEPDPEDDPKGGPEFDDKGRQITKPKAPPKREKITLPEPLNFVPPVHPEAAKEAGSPFPLVLLDAMMPEMDGFALAERIKDDPGLAGVTVMMLSSAGRRGDAIRCRELGVSAYLTKPVKARRIAIAAPASNPAVKPSTARSPIDFSFHAGCVFSIDCSPDALIDLHRFRRFRAYILTTIWEQRLLNVTNCASGHFRRPSPLSTPRPCWPWRPPGRSGLSYADPF